MYLLASTHPGALPRKVIAAKAHDRAASQAPLTRTGTTTRSRVFLHAPAQALEDADKAERQAQSLARKAARKLDEASKTAHAAKALVEIETLDEELSAEAVFDQESDPAPDQAFDKALDPQACPEGSSPSETAAGLLADSLSGEVLELAADTTAAAPVEAFEKASTQLRKEADFPESISKSSCPGTKSDETSQGNLEAARVHETNPAPEEIGRRSQRSESLPPAPVLKVSSVFRPKKGAHAQRLAESALVLAWKNGDCGLLPARCVETCVGDSDHARRQMLSASDPEINESSFALVLADFQSEDARCVNVCAGEVVRVADVAAVLAVLHPFAETQAQRPVVLSADDDADASGKVLADGAESMRPASLRPVSTIDDEDTAKLDNVHGARAADAKLGEIDGSLCNLNDPEQIAPDAEDREVELNPAPGCASAAQTAETAETADANDHTRGELLA
eukprot:6191489-Pleurochrysis_carterae.AAC.1